MSKLDHDAIRYEVNASLVGEADHRVANNLMMIVASLKAQASDLAGPMSAHDVQLLLGEAARRVEIVARLHRLLSQQAGDAVDVSAYLRDVCEALALSLTTADRFTLTGLDDLSLPCPGQTGSSYRSHGQRVGHQCHQVFASERCRRPHRCRHAAVGLRH